MEIKANRMARKVLIISLGSIGQRHLRNIRSLLPQAEIAVMRREGAAEGADHVFHDLQSSLNFNPDVAIVASPATEHLVVASALIKSAVPVLIEKPFADRLDGLAELVAQAEAASVPLFIAYNLRFHPMLTKVCAMLRENEIGRVLSVRAEVGQYLPDWRPRQRYQISVSARRDLGGGVLLELSHELDYILWLFGRPVRVFATGGRYSDLDIDVEDVCSLTLRYGEDGPLINVHLDFLDRAVNRRFRIVGASGTIVGDVITGQLEVYVADSGKWLKEVWSPPDPNQLYIDELQNFLSAVRGEAGPILPNGGQGMDVMCLIEAARRSMLEREEVEVTYE
jgi:predicted dehydrogenase